MLFFLFSIAKILNEGRLQRFIDSHERATIISVNSLFVEGVGILMGLAFGYISNLYNPRAGMFVFAGFVLIYLIFEVFFRNRNRNMPELGS